METALEIKNVLLRPFVVSYSLLCIICLLSITNSYLYFINLFYSFSANETERFVASLLSFVLFLVPATGIYWEYVWKKCRKK